MNRKNLVPILVLAVLIVLFIFTKMDNNTEKLISFFDVDSASVAAFQLATLQDTLKFEKSAYRWVITQPINYPADNSKIKSFFKNVLKVKTSSEPVSEQKSSFQKYSISDSLGTVLTLFDENGKILQEVVLGKSATGGNTPARKKDSEKIYRLEANINYNIRTELNNWRLREIAKIERAAISKISVIYGDFGYELVSSDTTWLFMDSEKTIPVSEDKRTLSAILNSLQKINVTGFYDNNKEYYLETLQQPVMEIAIEQKDGEKLYLRMTNAEEKKLVLQKNNETQYLYQLNEPWMNKFKKTAEDFGK